MFVGIDVIFKKNSKAKPNWCILVDATRYATMPLKSYKVSTTNWKHMGPSKE